MIDDRDSLIGGTAPGEGNVISSSVYGVYINGTPALGGSQRTRIQGNKIGTDQSGQQAIANFQGVYLDGSAGFESHDVLIGGTEPGAGNLISGNQNGGIILLGSGAQQVRIQGNKIGTNIAGTTAIPNSGSGVAVFDTNGTVIGGHALGEGNVIAFNNGAGVAVTGNVAVSNVIRGNSIHSNTGLGIDLGNDGVTLNNSGGHIGPNNFQNFPVIATAISSGGSTTINGSLDSAANATYSLDFYANASADPSGYGEGKRYLGSATVLTDGSGHVAFSINLSAGMSMGEVCSATATDSNGNTSEFSLHKTVALTGASLQPDTCEPGHTALVVIGTSGDDHIVINPVGNTGTVQVQLNGTPLGTFLPTGRIVVYAQGGNDDVQIAASISRSAWLYGGTGNDRLKGAAGDDVLLGEEGDDLLAGGSGRNLLIGGLGADRIVGNGGDDILIAGLTSYDSNETALCHVMHEWTRTDMEYYDRLAHLAEGDGLNEGFLFNASTIFNDTSEDVLTGSAGLDWFVFDDLLDKATDLNHEAFLSDLAFING